MAYITIDDLTAYLGITDDTDDEVLSAAIDSATKAIESYCDRVFTATAATEYYDQDAVDDGGQVLNLGGDWLTVTTLTNGDGDDIDTDNLWLLPRNETA